MAFIPHTRWTLAGGVCVMFIRFRSLEGGLRRGQREERGEETKQKSENRKINRTTNERLYRSLSAQKHRNGGFVRHLKEA